MRRGRGSRQKGSVPEKRPCLRQAFAPDGGFEEPSAAGVHPRLVLRLRRKPGPRREKVRMLRGLDGFTRASPATRLAPTDMLAEPFIFRGVPGHIRSDNGPEFIATALRTCLAAAGARCAFIGPGSPGENGCCESFTSKPRDELLNGETFESLAEARIGTELWRRHYTTRRPHSSLDDRPRHDGRCSGRLRHPHPLRPPPQRWRRDLRLKPDRSMGAGRRAARSDSDAVGSSDGRVRPRRRSSCKCWDFWYRLPGSNGGPPDPQSGALTN